MSNAPSREDCAKLDIDDPLASFRGEFVIPDDSLVYFDGNSLGRLPRSTVERVQHVLTDQWGSRLIRSWVESWVDLPTRLGDRIGVGLLNAVPGEVVVGDNTTVCLHKTIAAALDARSERRVVVVERDNFPTDRYVVESLAGQRGLEIRWVESGGVDGLEPGRLADVLDDQVAVAVLAHVDYRSAAISDMDELTACVHRVGALTVWDLCHSVGSVPIDLAAAGADLAVGCTYKYLNAGPGAPAFTFVRRDLQSGLSQPLWGWWGRSDMFDMAQGYLPYPDIRSWLTGTPGVLSAVGIEPGVDMIVRAGMDRVRAKSTALTTLAVRLYDEWLAPLGVSLRSPRDAGGRGSHVTLGHPEARHLADDLTARGVVPDFRRPDGIRIGLAPLTTRYVDVYDGLAVLRDLVAAIALPERRRTIG